MLFQDKLILYNAVDVYILLFRDKLKLYGVADVNDFAGQSYQIMI